MKVAILAGGFGSRLAEETAIRPKPMVEIGGHPLLWHIMRHYDHYGFTDFVVALGYKGEHIKKYFADYCSFGGDMFVNLKTRRIASNGQSDLGWTLNLVETGLTTNTGGRIKRLARHLADGTFMLTWGDGLSNVNLRKLLEFHQSHGKLATLTAVRPPARYGHLDLDGSKIVRFSEKPQASEGWINGAFFVLEPGVLDYIEGDNTQFEKEPLERLAQDGELMAFQHESFWQCMDTLREKHILETLWQSGQAPWKVWR
jgi:glucose-1-phosphate cytidylyltransferase